jgi:acetoin utilization protein AcuB
MVKAGEVIVIDPEATIEQAARVMVDHGIGCLPVLEAGIVVGIITDTDLLAQLTEMMVATPPHAAVRLVVRIPNIRGELAKLVSAIAAQGWGILSCGGALYAKDPSRWDAVIKLDCVDKDTAVAVLSQVEGHEIVDVREA